ncbi:MAG: LptF/LptG family permease [Planctomycetota bacterium]|nr:LptF/LptG family permease [Planctomycetota bacterium]
MLLIDRYILGRFLANFVILFSLLFVFAIAIDLILNLDDFVEATRNAKGEDANIFVFLATLIGYILDFQAPKFFQFYLYLHGLIAIGAMAFTLAQMHRFKELVAVLASGVSMQRIAMPFVAGTFVLSLVQLLNQELILPRVAPLLLRDHDEIGKSGLGEFEVPFTSDGHGTLLLAPSYNPDTLTLTSPTFIEREDRRTTSKRILADKAVWDTSRRGWRLEGGQAIIAVDLNETQSDEVVQRETIDFYASEISPELLTVRRYAQFAGMLSLAQIREMLSTPGATDDSTRTLTRYRFSRFSSVLVNILVMVLTLPCFLLREPSNLMRQSVICASLAVPFMFGAALGMMADIPGFSPVAGVFLPIFILVPIALARVTMMKT